MPGRAVPVVLGGKKAMESYRVEVIIKPSKEGGYLAEVPALQGCWCVSDTVEAALDDVQEVIALAIPARREVGEPLPPEVEEEVPTGLYHRILRDLGLQDEDLR